MRFGFRIRQGIGPHAWHYLTIAERPYRSTHSERYRWRVGALAALALVLLGSPWGLGLGPACRYHHDCTLHAAVSHRERGCARRLAAACAAACSRGAVSRATAAPARSPCSLLLTRCMPMSMLHAPRSLASRLHARGDVTWCEVCQEGASPPAARLET